MATKLKQLGQIRPANTTAVSLYSPGADTQTIIKSIIVCNTSGSSATFRIFVDDNGTTYDQATALFYDVALAANNTLQIVANILPAQRRDWQNASLSQPPRSYPTSCSPSSPLLVL